MNSADIKNIESEAGIVATIILKPEFTYYSEHLKPNYFSDPANAYIYYAVSELAKRGVQKIDAYNIVNFLNSKKSTEPQTKSITIETLNELIDVAGAIARDSVEEYNLLVENVVNAARRRILHSKLQECEKLCFVQKDNGELQQKIYSSLDNVMLEFSTSSDIPQYKDVVDGLWQEIQSRQNGKMAGIPFKFPTLNQYATIERGELFLFAAEAKQGKSMVLLNCAVDLLRKKQAVLYIDSELSSRMFTVRLLSHITKIPFGKLKSGNYGKEEEEKIAKAIAWLKTRKFTHLYMPIFDAQSIYTAVKRTKHTQGLDVLIVDYFKGNGDGDAFMTYMELGKLVDMVKNNIAGAMDIAALGAVQATSTGKIADSAKICRNASAVAFISDKTPEEIEADGIECGNKKLRICFNRNGMQMIRPSDYIDLNFNGNSISFEEAKQHTELQPF